MQAFSTVGSSVVIGGSVGKVVAVGPSSVGMGGDRSLVATSDAGGGGVGLDATKATKKILSKIWNFIIVFFRTVRSKCGYES